MTLVEITEFSRDRIVENQAARGRNDKIRIIIVESVRTVFLRDVNFDEIMDTDFVQCISQHDFVITSVSMQMGGIHLIFSLLPFLGRIEGSIRMSSFFFRREVDFVVSCCFHDGQVIGSEDHILRRNSNRLAVFCRKDVIDGKHQRSCFGLRFYGQRQMACHLVTVEVGVVARTYERMQFDCTAFPEDRFKCLDTESVKCRSAVQENRVFLDNVAKDIPDFRSELVDFLAGSFQVDDDASLD